MNWGPGANGRLSGRHSQTHSHTYKLPWNESLSVIKLLKHETSKLPQNSDAQRDGTVCALSGVKTSGDGTNTEPTIPPC